MKRNAFVPTVEDRLEDRVVLTAHAAATALPPANFGGGQIDYTIPFVAATNIPDQNNLDFTSHTFHMVVKSSEKDFAAFNRTGNVIGLKHGLSALVRKVPFGIKQFAPTVASDLSGLSPTNRDPSGAVQNRLLNDLLIYLDNGIGQKFNIIKSHQGFSTDKLLTYNVKG